MGKLVGSVLILAGVGTAAYVVPGLDGVSDTRAEKQLTDVVSIATNGRATAPARSGDGSAAPDSGKARIITAETAPGKPGIGVTVKPMLPTETVNATGKATAPLPAAANAKSPAEKANDPARIALAREIQKELKRVGCYKGDSTGTWTPETQAAMRSFIERVNATLPIDEPDHILKTLVQGHPGNACGVSCPTGQSMAGDGRCQPTSILARAGTAKKPAPADAAQKPSTPSAAPVAAAAAAAVASAPVIASVSPPAPTPPAPVLVNPPARQTSSWEPVVKPAPVDVVVPAKASTPPAPVAVAAPVPAPAPVVTPPTAVVASAQPVTPSAVPTPLPAGRMAVGAPADATPVVPEAVAPVAVTPAAPSPPVVKIPRPKVVVKPRERQSNDDEPSEKAASRASPSNGDSGSRPAIGAVAAAQDDDKKSNGNGSKLRRAEKVEEDEKPARKSSPAPVYRAAPPPPPPAPKVAAYRPPPPPAPRYVGASNYTPAYRERSRFGPQIFRQMDMNAR